MIFYTTKVQNTTDTTEYFSQLFSYPYHTRSGFVRVVYSGTADYNYNWTTVN